MQRATENVFSIVDYILETYHKRVGVMGIILGGMITFYSVANYPRIRGAVCGGLAHPKLPLRRRPTHLLIGMGAKLWPKKRLSLLKIVPLKKVTMDPILQNVLLTDELVVSEYTFETVASFMKFKPNTPLDQIQTPILIMVGEHEQILSPEYCKKVYDFITTEKFIVVPHVGHLLFIEHLPQTLPIVVDWFTKTLK